MSRWGKKGVQTRVKECKQVSYQPRPRTPALRRDDGKARMVVSVPKSEPVRDRDYLRWVASLPCAHCQVEGYSQAAHGDEGKGMAIKSSDDTAYPACGPRPMEPGCHWLIGTSGTFTREERRALESQYGKQTRALWAERQKA